MPLARSSLMVLVLASTGCFHATVTTGATPSLDVIEQPFASSFIGGLVPPKTVETASKCPSGVAKVETQQSFVNGLVAFLTLGIYTPMNIKVTCAAGSVTGSAADAATTIVATGSDQAAVQEAFEMAARKALASHDVILVRVAQP